MNTSVHREERRGKSSIWSVVATGGGRSPDLAEVRRAVGILFAPDHTYEIRALHPGAVSRLVSLRDVDHLVDVVADLSVTHRSIYYTLNPVFPEIGDGKSASAKDVVSRRLILIDIDPVKSISDESASDEERQAAIDLGIKVVQWLQSIGWPNPIVIDSGNGVHLLYRIELPNNAGSRVAVKGLLYALAAAFDNAKAKIDKSVHDASRVAKLPGTWSQKGTDQPGRRPHRLSRIMSVPEVEEVVTAAQIESARAQLQAIARGSSSVEPPTIGTTPGGCFKVVATDVDHRSRYIAEALEGETRAILSAGPGTRNETLNRAAFNMGTLDHHPEFDRESVERRLSGAAVAVGLDDREIARTLKNGLEAGERKPRAIPSVELTKDVATQAGRLQGGSSKPGEIDYAAMGLGDLSISSLLDVAERPIDWLWSYRLAKGEMALTAGEGGLGKSQILLSIAAALSNGSEWPDKSGRAPVGRTLILAAEDSPETTIKPRLMAMGADIGQISIVKAQARINRPGKEPLIHPMSLQDIPYWEAVFDKLPGTVLLIVDPLPSYLGRGVNDSKNSELRGVLEPFIDRVIRPRGVCLLANTHLNKSVDSRTAVHRINGSVAYANLARNTHFVVRDPDDPSHRFFKQGKCNNASEDLTAIGFRIESRIVHSSAGDIETAIPVFDAEGTHIDLAEAMAGEKKPGKRRGREPAKTAELAAWLFDYLASEGRPVQAGPLFDAAATAFPEMMGEKQDNGLWAKGNNLHRAADHIPRLESPRDGAEVAKLRDPDSGRWFWRLLSNEPAF